MAANNEVAQSRINATCVFGLLVTALSAGTVAFSRFSARGGTLYDTSAAAPSIRRQSAPAATASNSSFAALSPCQLAASPAPCPAAALPPACIASTAPRIDRLKERWAALRNCVIRAADPGCAALPYQLHTAPPFDEWLEHAIDIQQLAASVGQGFGMHTYAGYSGPWIENVFIQQVNRSLEAWYPLVPIPAQWTDVAVGREGVSRETRSQWTERLWDALFASHVLRDDYMYITVTQHDVGRPLANVETRPVDNCHAFRNVLVASAGGWGNVVVPLIKDDVRRHDQDPRLSSVIGSRAVYRKYVLSFKGANHQGRDQLFNGLEEAARYSLPREYIYINNNELSWQHVAMTSVFGMSPRGYGRTAFRAFELLQAGTLAVLAYNDVPWVPYAKAVMPNNQSMWGAGGVGVVIQYGQAHALLCSLCTLFYDNSASVPTYAADFANLFERMDRDRSSCVCDAAEWRRVLPLDADGMFTFSRTSVVGQMEQHLTSTVIDQYFAYDGALQRLLEFVQRPWEGGSAVSCVERPATYKRRL